MSGFSIWKCPVCGYEWSGTLGSPKLIDISPSSAAFEERLAAMCPKAHKHSKYVKFKDLKFEENSITWKGLVEG